MDPYAQVVFGSFVDLVFIVVGTVHEETANNAPAYVGILIVFVYT